MKDTYPSDGHSSANTEGDELGWGNLLYKGVDSPVPTELSSTAESKTITPDMCVWKGFDIKDIPCWDDKTILDPDTGIFGSFTDDNLEYRRNMVLYRLSSTFRDSDGTDFLMFGPEGNDNLVCITRSKHAATYLEGVKTSKEWYSYDVAWGRALVNADPATFDPIIEQLRKYGFGCCDQVTNALQAQCLYDMYNRQQSGEALTDDDLMTLWLGDKGEWTWAVQEPLSPLKAAASRVKEMQEQRNQQADVAHLINTYGVDEVFERASGYNARNNAQQLVDSGINHVLFLKKVAYTVNTREDLQQLIAVGFTPEEVMRAKALDIPNHYARPDALERLAQVLGAKISSRLVEELLEAYEWNLFLEDPIEQIDTWLEMGVSPEIVADVLNQIAMRHPPEGREGFFIKDQEALQKVIEYGAKVDALVDRITEYHHQIFLSDLLPFLLENGADVQHLAEKMDPVGVFFNIDTLREHGAKIDIDQLTMSLPRIPRQLFRDELLKLGVDPEVLDSLDK